LIYHPDLDILMPIHKVFSYWDPLTLAAPLRMGIKHKRLQATPDHVTIF
jgi:hypothetical protein